MMTCEVVSYAGAAALVFAPAAAAVTAVSGSRKTLSSLNWLLVSITPVISSEQMFYADDAVWKRVICVYCDVRLMYSLSFCLSRCPLPRSLVAYLGCGYTGCVTKLAPGCSVHSDTTSAPSEWSQ